MPCKIAHKIDLLMLHEIVTAIADPKPIPELVAVSLFIMMNLSLIKNTNKVNSADSFLTADFFVGLHNVGVAFRAVRLTTKRRVALTRCPGPLRPLVPLPHLVAPRAFATRKANKAMEDYLHSLASLTHFGASTFSLCGTFG